MHIKQQNLEQHLQKKIAPIYLLSGEDNYLFAKNLNMIQARIHSLHEGDKKTITIQSPEHWADILEEANSYSLFAQYTVLTIFYDKKSFDATGKKILTQYLTAINPRCFLIICAPHIPTKQLQWLAIRDEVLHVVAYPLNALDLKNWLIHQLKGHQFQFEPSVPDLIYQYTQGNMLACAQVIEKLSLSHELNSQITTQDVLEHLSNQCEHSLFELADACLLSQTDKAIQIIRHAVSNKIEATLVLWILSQEIRNLVRLAHGIKQQVDFKSLCSQLKIWPQRIPLYQAGIKRLDASFLVTLIHDCQLIDEQVKSNLNTQVWNALERLAINLCQKQPIGAPCSI